MHELQSLVIEKVISKLWENYKNKVSQVGKIEEAIRLQGDSWSEDHIAFRTLPGKHCGLHILQALFELLGYTKSNDYRFTDKKLTAISMDPPNNKSLHSTKIFPKIFISVLDADGFSSKFKECLLKYTNDVTASPLEKLKSEFVALQKNSQKIDEFSESIHLFLSNGGSWRTPLYEDYEILRKESEYAAWTLVYGNTPNHFTVSIHLMKNFKSLSDFNSFIQTNLGIKMNTSGGSLIKGTPEVMLEQSATLAEEVLTPFQECFKKIPYAFVEFAYRHPLQESKMMVFGRAIIKVL